MTSIRIRIYEKLPIYKQYKTKPPKLLKIENKEYEHTFMSHDSEQASCYMRNFIERHHNHEKIDQNYRFDYDYIDTTYS